jgi:hypothetical protein
MHCTYPSAYGVLESKIISIRDMCVHNGAFLESLFGTSTIFVSVAKVDF